MAKKTSANPRGYSNGHKVRLFVTYWGLIVMVVALALFSVGAMLSGTLYGGLGVMSLILAGIATFYHVRRGEKDRLDEIADSMK